MGFQRAVQDISNEYSLYVNIPYCHRPCKFCHYRDNLRFGFSEVPNSYLESLCNHLDEVLSWIPDGRRVVACHFGGGTPSLLSGRQWECILDRIKPFFSTGTEVSVEIDPTHWKDFYLSLDTFNRFSFAVQSFSSDILRGWNRAPFSYDSLMNIVNEIKKKKHLSINIDLLASPAITQEDIVLVNQLSPESITVYPDTKNISYETYPLIEEMLANVRQQLSQYSPLRKRSFIFTKSGAFHSKYSRHEYELGDDVVGVGEGSLSSIGDRVYLCNYTENNYIYHKKNTERHQSNVIRSLPIGVSKAYVEKWFKDCLPFVLLDASCYYLPQENYALFYRQLPQALRSTLVQACLYGSNDHDLFKHVFGT